LNERQDPEGFEASEAMLLMDNCSNHMPDDVIAMLTRVRVRIVIFVIHTTYIFQVLGMMLSGALKKHATNLETLDAESRAAAFVLKVYRDFK
jgi:hypothetical protein